MATWFVAAALPWLVVVLALNYFLIVGMYGRGEKAGSGSETVGAPQQRPVARTVLAALRNSLCGRRRMRRLQAR